MHISISIYNPSHGKPPGNPEIHNSKLLTMSILNVEISWFNSYMDPKPAGQISLLQWLTSEQYQPTAEAIRMIKDKAERDAKKALLPAITPSGTFSHRSDQSMLEHSGFICLDIDRKDNPHLANFFELKSELCKIKQVAYCGLSVSGEGYYVLIPIAFPEKHQMHFQALLQLFTQFNIRLDQKCGNLSRLRGYSWDPKAYFNHHATPFTGIIITPPRPALTRSTENSLPYSSDFEKVERLVRQIEQKGIDITTDYNDWFAIACNLASTFGENGREYFHRISQFHPDYTLDKTNRKFSDALKKQTQNSMGAFFRQCQRFSLG